MKTYKLPFPPSVNSYYRHPGGSGPLAGRHLISREGRNYRTAVQAAVLTGDRAGLPFKGKLAFTVFAAPPDHRRRDLDNLLKGLQDALCHAGVYVDDFQIDDLRVVRCAVDATDPHVLVTLRPVDEATVKG